MNTYIYIRNTSFPVCKHCNKQLDFYIPTLEDAEHECDDCWPKKASEKISNALIEIVKKNIGFHDKEYKKI